MNKLILILSIVATVVPYLATYAEATCFGGGGGRRGHTVPCR
jgi:hypothetical protein